MLASWQFWAVLSAGFAALTAIFAKVGIENVGSDFATFIRTVVILVVLAAMLTVGREWQPLGSVSRRSYLFLVLSGLATGGVVAVLFPGAEAGRRGAGGADRQAERGAGGGVRGAVPGRAAVRRQLGGRGADRCRGGAAWRIGADGRAWARGRSGGHMRRAGHGAGAAPSNREVRCLALVAYTEAAVDGIAGMAAVIRVVRNRMADPRFPGRCVRGDRTGGAVPADRAVGRAAEGRARPGGLQHPASAGAAHAGVAAAAGRGAPAGARGAGEGRPDRRGAVFRQSGLHEPDLVPVVRGAAADDRDRRACVHDPLPAGRAAGAGGAGLQPCRVGLGAVE